MRDHQLKTFDFRVTPNPNFMLDINLDVEFDKSCFNVQVAMVLRNVYQSLTLLILSLAQNCGTWV